MLILLPPSQTKHVPARGRPMSPGRLSFAGLEPVRREVAAALAQASSAPDATDRLGVTPGLVGQLALNTRLDTAPAVPVAQLYTGVLYDALDAPGLSGPALARARRWVVVVSALYGALRLTDRVAPYRLSMAVSLPGTGPLAARWREPLAGCLPRSAGAGVVLDCRSSTYVAAWTPDAELARRWVQVRVPGATHAAKHTRGLVARHLCEHGRSVRTPAALADLLAPAFATTLHEPARPGRPWVLDVTA